MTAVNTDLQFSKATISLTVFITKTWGFDDPTGPLQFSTRGWMERARTMLADGDLVAIVGTHGPPTREDQRGKVLGFMEPTKLRVTSLDYDLQPAPHDFDEQGAYKWPYGLELKAAWLCDEPWTDLAALTYQQFSMDAVQGIVAINGADAARMLALPRSPADLLRPLTAAARVEGEKEARRKAAPPPSTTRTGIMHLRRFSAFTYAMQIEGSRQPACKIGWAFDVAARARQFNLYAMPQLGGLKYRVHLQQLWPTAMEAFRMEQALLKKLDPLRQPGNHEIVAPISLGQLEADWIDYLSKARGRAAEHPR